MTGETAALRARFEALLGAGEDALDLGEAALLIGAEAEPGTDVDRWLRRLDALGAEARPRVQAAGDPADQARALCRFLYDEYGLRGNRDAYYDPRNSYLHHVLARGLGIPITLAVVLVEVGRRAGLPLVGVGFPAHFLVRHRDVDLFLDPFDQGRPLSVAGCRTLLEERAGGVVPFQPDLLRPVSGREVLARMLRNLKAIHLREGDLEAALGVAERLVLVRPDDPEERRDRGLLRAALRRPGPAVDDLAGYLARRPAAPDARAVRAQLDEARRRLWEMN
ncbi:MAG: tetratricopeptide repeat protein [Planctomycetes bacterium]|nr:tetratricopeptide repeat protein [Planctomycetota bacterium]